MGIEDNKVQSKCIKVQTPSIFYCELQFIAFMESNTDSLDHVSMKFFNIKKPLLRPISTTMATRHKGMQRLQRHPVKRHLPSGHTVIRHSPSEAYSHKA